MAARLGRYEIRKELGRGGMATVYLGYDPQFKREVAVKVLPPQFTHDPSFFSRFEQEAETIAGLEHTAIVPVYDYGREQDNPYFVMRLMAGDLRQAIQQHALPPQQALAISQRICAALDKAHGRGIVHRDIKPSNILFDDDGFAYLADFGIVRLAELTHTVTMIGTAEYMTPEQIRGEGVDGRSDIYQMGVVIFEMLTGQQPFTGENTAALLYKHAHEPAPALRDLNAALPAACEAVIQRALAKYPTDRFATAGALAAALAAALQMPETVSRTAVPSVLVEQSRLRQEPPASEQAAPEPVTQRATPAKPQREQAAAPTPSPPTARETPPNGQTTAVSLPLLGREAWRGLGWWVAGSTLGWLLALFLVRPVAAMADSNSYGYVWPPAVILAIMGLVWGTGQWLALRAYYPVSARWIGATAVGFWLPGMFFVASGWGGLGFIVLAGPFADLIFGVLLGGAQWLLLRRLDNAWVWIPAVTVGLLLNRWLSAFFYNHFDFYSGTYGLPAGTLWIPVSLLNGALWGVVTGAALVWLVRRARQATT